MKTWDRTKNLPLCKVCGNKRRKGTKNHELTCAFCDDKFCYLGCKGLRPKTCSKECHSALMSKKTSLQMKHLEVCGLCGDKKMPHGLGIHGRKCKACGTKFCDPRGERLTCSDECRWESRKASFPKCGTCHERILNSAGPSHNRKCKVCKTAFCGKTKTCSSKCRYRLTGKTLLGHAPNPGSGNGKTGYRKDIGITARSTWEANYARILNHKGKKWKYEPKRFILLDGTSYTPDFKIGKVYYEVKGYVSDEWKEKRDKFRAAHPGTRLKVVGPKKYRRLERKYRWLPHWEAA